MCVVDAAPVSVDVKELLFVDELSRKTPSNRDEVVKIIQYQESPGTVL